MPKAKVKEVKLTKAGKVPKKRGRPKSKKRMYFDEVVQDAIVQYNTSDNDAFRNRIYQDKIHPAFDKLCENIINTFRFTYFDDKFEDVKNEVVAFLVMNIHKYDHTKGSKAFSYFSIVAKNYLILHNNANYKKYKTHTDTSALDYNRNDYHSDYEGLIVEAVKYFDYNIPIIFKKKRDKDIAYAVVELFKRKDDIENYNKKSLYILIREMTNVDTVHITKVVNVLRTHYRNIQNEYAATGDIKLPNQNKFF